MNGIELLSGVFPGEREALRALYEKSGENLATLLDTDENGLVSMGATRELAEKLVLLAPLAREYFISENKDAPAVTDSEKARAFLEPYFTGVKTEKLVIAYLNGRGEVISVKENGGGTTDRIAFQPAECMREAIRLKAKAVALAHNHPQGFAVPSQQDIRMTSDLAFLLKDVNIAVCEHVIFAGNDACFISSYPSTEFLAFSDKR